MQNNWTTDQVLGLSPDHFTIRSGRGNAKSTAWQSLGQNDRLVWGAFENTKRPSFQVTLSLAHMQFSCTCGSGKFPCPHIVGLNLLWHRSPERFGQSSAPKWAQLSQTRFLQQWHRQQESTDSAVDSQELQELKAGLDELERWLHDLMQDGLATLPSKPKIFWETIANRMADVQALTLTKQLKNLIRVGQAKPDWPEHYLRRLSPLALLIASFKRFDEQSPAAQADLLRATGRPFPQQYNGRLPMHDQWLVLGHHIENVGNYQQMVSWLWGLNQNRPACLIQTLRSKHAIGTRYFTGSTLSGELQFALSHFPLIAKFTDRPIIRQAPEHHIGETSIITAVHQYSSAKSQNPWLEHFPFLLRGVVPILENGRWSIIDSEQVALPLPPKFNYGWHLKSLSCGEPIALFGLWDGEMVKPLSAKINGRWVDLHTFRGIK